MRGRAVLSPHQARGRPGAEPARCAHLIMCIQPPCLMPGALSSFSNRTGTSTCSHTSGGVQRWGALMKLREQQVRCRGGGAGASSTLQWIDEGSRRRARYKECSAAELSGMLAGQESMWSVFWHVAGGQGSAAQCCKAIGAHLLGRNPIGQLLMNTRAAAMNARFCSGAGAGNKAAVIIPKDHGILHGSCTHVPQQKTD